jgi:hypothetical protein
MAQADMKSGLGQNGFMHEAHGIGKVKLKIKAWL